MAKLGDGKKPVSISRNRTVCASTYARFGSCCTGGARVSTLSIPSSAKLFSRPSQGLLPGNYWRKMLGISAEIPKSNRAPCIYQLEIQPRTIHLTGRGDANFVAWCEYKVNMRKRDLQKAGELRGRCRTSRAQEHTEMCDECVWHACGTRFRGGDLSNARKQLVHQ